MTVRAKFRVTSFTTSMGTRANAEGVYEPVELRSIDLSPVVSGSAENAEFYAYTPGGVIKLATVNPAVWEQFVLNGEYYVDFTPADG